MLKRLNLRSRTWGLTAALFVSVGLSNLIAGDANAQSVLILETEFEGDLNEGVQERFRQAIYTGLTEGTTYEVVTESQTRVLLGDDADRLMSCRGDVTCLQEAGTTSGAAIAVEATISEAGEIYDFTIDVYDIRAGTGITFNDTDCALCTIDEAINVAREFAASNATTFPEFTDARAEPTQVTIFIDTIPEPGVIFINGEQIGVAPVEFTAEPGDYEIRAELEDFDSVVANVEITDSDMQVSMELVPSDPYTAGARRSGGAFDNIDTTAFGSALTGAGLGGLVAGVVLLILDGDTTCSEGEDSACPDVYNTLAGGVTLTILGAATLTTGTIMLLWDTLAGPPVAPTANTAMGVGFTPEGGAQLIFGGNF